MPKVALMTILSQIYTITLAQVTMTAEDQILVAGLTVILSKLQKDVARVKMKK
jgi:hypothetical protein